MGRTKVSHKLCDGLANHLNEKLLQDVRKSKFSFNIDKCMSNAREKTFSILVSYYSNELMRVVVQHYKLASFTTVNTNNLFDYVINSLRDNEIPLVDSTNYMTGKITGFESILRTEAPHLLDINGNTCHYVHNASKNTVVTDELMLPALTLPYYICLSKEGKIA